MNIQGLQKLTLLDYPGHMACTVFTGGCNFRCPYCHNSGLVLTPHSSQSMTDEEFFAFLESRRGKLEGVCVTGGEPTLQPDLPDFLRRIHALGFLTKLDTNGSNPKLLATLLHEKLVNYVAMDVKNGPSRYGETVGVPGYSTANVEESIQLLLSGDVDYEFRTTVTAELHDESTMQEIGDLLQGAKQYFLQPYRDSEQVLLPNTYHAPDTATLQHYKELLTPHIASVTIRGLS